MAADPPGVDLARLRALLAERRPGLVTGELSAEVIAGGKSNLTYLLTDGEHRWVLRRPPLGHVLATAHDMTREYRVIRALAGSGVPVPAALLSCVDPEVIGAPFYLMSYVDATVYRTAADSAVLSPDRAEAISGDLMAVLARLHDVDPASRGLADFGRPEGFLARQLRRWQTQLDASRSRDLPGIDQLHAELAGTLPPAGPAGIVHGDYRLDNVMIGADDRVAAVLDWEMATLGDPLADLGLMLVYWTGLAGLPGTALSSGVTEVFPGRDWLVGRYAAARPVDLSRLDWYVAFGFFKLAVIAEGIHRRYSAGQTVGAGFAGIGDVVLPLVEQGRAALRRAG